MFKRKLYFLCIGINVTLGALSQNASIESLVNSVLSYKTETERQDRYIAIDDSLDKANVSKINYYFLDSLIKKSHRTANRHMEAVGEMGLGNFYLGTGNSYNSIEAFRRSQALFEADKNYSGLCNVYLNMGNTFFYMEDYDKAEKYYKEAIVYYEKTPDKGPNGPMKMANIYNNLGGVYGSKKDFVFAKTYFELGLKAYQKIHDSISIAYSYNNFGSIFSELKNQDSAMYYYQKALALKLRFGSNSDKADGLSAVAETYNVLKRPKKALPYLDRAMTFLDSTVYTRHLIKCYFQYYVCYQALKDCGKEILYYKLYKAAEDSSASRNKISQISRLELQFEFSKIHLADSIKSVQEIKLSEAKLSEKKQQSYFLIIVLILTVAALGIIYSRFKITKQQKLIIEDQKLVVDLKNKEIIESINYAKRLQDAILPGSQQLKATFKENFVFYKPKDIVAGDFYWMESPNSDLTILAAADCTGHGVPGAMISIACNNALHRAVTEFGNTDPGKILDATKKIISESFNKSENTIRDGMDISLLCIDKKKKNVTWSGANNRLLYIMNNELLEIKPDKHPIGKSDNFTNFKTHIIPYVEGTVFYLFTDGIIDQFGGKETKKFMISNFKKLLDDNKERPLIDQLTAIETAFNVWKGNIEQIDDITVLAIKL